MSDSLRDIYRALESRYFHEGRTIDTSFYNDLSDDSVAKFTAIGFNCLLSLDEQICPRFIFEFYKTLKLKTLEKIEPYNLRLPALDDIRNLIHRRTVHENIDKEGNTIYKLPNQIETSELFDHLRPCELVIRENVYSAIGNRDHTQAENVLTKGKITQLTISSSTESPPSDNEDLPSTKLSPRSYHRALKDDPNMSKEQRETRGMFKNLDRALHNFARMLKKGCL
ncbi:hypothetical protein Tco_0455605 [Tanacetum coccineum]